MFAVGRLSGLGYSATTEEESGWVSGPFLRGAPLRDVWALLVLHR
jgi:hypothetical protein